MLTQVLFMLPPLPHQCVTLRTFLLPNTSLVTTITANIHSNPFTNRSQVDLEVLEVVCRTGSSGLFVTATIDVQTLLASSIRAAIIALTTRNLVLVLATDTGAGVDTNVAHITPPRFG